MPAHSQFYNEVSKALYKKDLIGALYQLKAWISTLSNWELELDWDKITNGYRALLSYQIEGAQDEQRGAMYTQFMRSTWSLAEKARREEGIKTSSNEYYVTLRGLNHTETAAELINKLENLQQQLLFDTLTTGHGSNLSQTRKQESEELARRLFLKTWTSEEWTSSTRQFYTATIKSASLDNSVKLLLISAVMLSLNDIFDANKLIFLVDTCRHRVQEVRQRALVSLALTLRLHDKTISYYEKLGLSPELIKQLHELIKQPSAIQYFTSLQFHLFNCTQADEIQRTIHEEIMPGIIKSGLGKNRFINLNEIEELLDDDNNVGKHFDSETAQNLRQGMEYLMKLHEEGMDMYYTSFRGLKSHPFFSQISNWFLPFNEEHSEVSQGIDNVKEFLRPIIESQSMCDSDLYSLCFLMTQFPRGQVDAIRNQIKAMLGDVIDKSKTINAERTIEGTYTALLQNYFRFFTLYRGRKSFRNPFDSELIPLPEISILQNAFSDQSIREMAYWAYNHSKWDTAIRLYDLIKEKTHSTDYLLLAEALEQSGNIDAAIDKFQHTLILNPHEERAKFHLSRLLMKEEKYDDAANIYKQILNENPENVSALFHYGECLLETGHTDEALAQFFRIDYLKPNFPPAMRAIIWCSLLTNQLEQAERYFKKIEAGHPKPEDYLYGGHTAWLAKNIRLAVDRYRRYTTSPEMNGKIFHFSDEDSKLLVGQGLTQEELQFMEDYLNLPETI